MSWTGVPLWTTQKANLFLACSILYTTDISSTFSSFTQCIVFITLLLHLTWNSSNKFSIRPIFFTRFSMQGHQEQVPVSSGHWVRGTLDRFPGHHRSTYSLKCKHSIEKNKILRQVIRKKKIYSWFACRPKKNTSTFLKIQVWRHINAYTNVQYNSCLFKDLSFTVNIWSNIQPFKSHIQFCAGTNSSEISRSR